MIAATRSVLRFSSVRRVIGLAIVAGCLSSPSARADELALSWMALPDETAVMLRLPGIEAFIDALQKQTKLGAVVLSQERFDRLLDLLHRRSQEDWEGVQEELGRVGLKPEDLQGLFRGDLGVALTLEPRGDRTPLVVLLGWLEPGEELAPRLLAAVQSVVGELADLPSAPVRKDIELAGHDVMHLQIPVMGEAQPEISEVDEDDDSKERIEADIEDAKKQLAEPRSIEIDRVQFFVSRLGGRLVWACTVPQSSDEVQKKSDAEREAIDWDALTGLEQATAVFGRFLSAHEGGSQAGGVRRLLETPGLEASLPGGTSLFELVVDPRPLIKLAELANNPKVKQGIESVGLGSLGPFGLRMAIDGTTFRSGAFLSMPAPRAGLLSLFDQPALEPELPAWVPASAIGYDQVSFDANDAYERVKALMIELSGDQAKQSFDQIEAAAKLFLQTDLNDLFSSFGTQFSQVTFAPRFVAAPKTEENDEGAEDGLTASVQRMGIVCKVKDEMVVKRFLKAASQFFQGSLKPVEELGVSGYRMDQAGTELGVFVGNGYMVFGIGPEVSETLLVALRTPPEGDAAMRSRGLVERGRALLAPRPCLTFQLSDADANAKLRRQTINLILDAAINGHVPGVSARFDQHGLFEQLKSVLPSDAELEGVMGVRIGQTLMTDEGWLIQSALELPAP